MGTPAFMSPEQCRGAGHVDCRTDVYALGCVLFMLLTGRLPFEAKGPGDMLVMHLTAPPPRASYYAYVPPAVDALIAACLDKDPARRPATGHDLAQALGRVLYDLGLATSPPLPVAAETIAVRAPAPTTLSGAAAVVTERKRGNGLLVGLGVAAVVSAIGGAGAMVAMSATSPEVAAAAPDTQQQMSDALIGFLRWSTSHHAAECPRSIELGLPRGMVVTCTDQPDDQIIGIVAAGPDGALGTADDVKSWTIPNLAALVAGPRWTVR